jgi:hypothetical protein
MPIRLNLSASFRSEIGHESIVLVNRFIPT